MWLHQLGKPLAIVILWAGFAYDYVFLSRGGQTSDVSGKVRHAASERLIIPNYALVWFGMFVPSMDCLSHYSEQLIP
jgi:hypothetical protein